MTDQPVPIEHLVFLDRKSYHPKPVHILVLIDVQFNISETRVGVDQFGQSASRQHILVLLQKYFLVDRLLL